METSERIARLERGFNPRNVAVIGAARHNNFGWLKRHMPSRAKYGAGLFHVNVNKEEWLDVEKMGLSAYASVLDIPEPIDYVTISVPRKVVPTVLEDCIKKNVTLIHIFAAGFEESGQEEGQQLDKVVREMARKADTLVIGPNCMGIYNPKSGLRHTEDQFVGDPGSLGYISNSGSQAISLVAHAFAEGIPVSKCLSMGNGMILDQSDYMEYFLQDQDTKVIGIYMEGLRNAPRFFKTLREVTKTKPVVIWKVGQTEDAARAVTAHSGTTPMRQDHWDALVNRCGGIQVNSLEEMLDTIKALSVPKETGYRVACIASTGGHSTEMANAMSRGGFKVGPFSSETYKELGSFLSAVGGNFVNPIEGGGAAQHFGRIVDILSKDRDTDIVAIELPAGRLAASETYFDDRLADIKKVLATTTKPIVTVITGSFPKVDSAVQEKVNQRMVKEGIPAFYSFERAAAALKHVVDDNALKAYLPD